MLSGCGKDPIPASILEAYDQRATAMCVCMKMADTRAAKECRDKLDEVPPPEAPPSQDVTRASYSALRGFRTVYVKCQMGVNGRK